MQPALIENTVAVSCSDCMLWPEETVGETRQMKVTTYAKSCFRARV